MSTEPRLGANVMAVWVAALASAFYLMTARAAVPATVTQPPATDKAVSLSASSDQLKPERQRILPMNHDEAVWPRLKLMISTLDDIRTPLSPSDLARLLALNMSAFQKAKETERLGTYPHQMTQFRYENVPDDTKRIGVTLYVTRKDSPSNVARDRSEDILINAWPLDKSLCLSFESIRADLTSLGWDGRPPGFYRGVDGTNTSDSDVLYLKKYTGGIGLFTIYLTKHNSCVIHILGVLKNVGGNNRAW